MRGMIKWKPFNSLLNNKDIDEINKARYKVIKPVISKDRIIEIDFNIKEALNNNSDVEIKYFSINTLKYVIGKIDKINIYQKYILINNYRIYFKDIINLKIIS